VEDYQTVIFTVSIVKLHECVEIAIFQEIIRMTRIAMLITGDAAEKLDLNKRNMMVEG